MSVQHDIYMLEIEEGLLQCQLGNINSCSDRFHRLEDHLRRIVMDKQRLTSQEQSLMLQIRELED